MAQFKCKPRLMSRVSESLYEPLIWDLLCKLTNWKEASCLTDSCVIEYLVYVSPCSLTIFGEYENVFMQPVFDTLGRSTGRDLYSILKDCCYTLLHAERGLGCCGLTKRTVLIRSALTYWGPILTGSSWAI